ncbi:hypothetical protein BDW69DRAFT_195986 [Aspergillus filifer]
MVNVAVAGGTRGIGRTLLDALASSQHNSFVLSRKVRGETITILQTGPYMLTVDYDGGDSLVEALESNEIHTVTSAFGINDKSLSEPQANLIEAAKCAAPPRKLIPTSAVEVLPQLKDYFAAIDTLKESGLEWTVSHCGILPDYYGRPGSKTQMKHNNVVIDLDHNVAAIPGDGNMPVTFTYTIDLAKVVGDTLIWNDFVSLTEQTVGAKFDVHYDSIEKLKSFEITELSSHRALYENFPKKTLQ